MRVLVASKHCTRVYGICNEAGSVPWVLTGPPNISLWDLIHLASEIVAISEEENLYMLAQVGMALSFLHGQRPPFCSATSRANHHGDGGPCSEACQHWQRLQQVEGPRSTVTYADAAYDVCFCIWG